MASRSFLPEEDLTCTLCFDIFIDPVLLLCSHSFCKTCLHEYWKDRGARECPVCRKRFYIMKPPCNLALKNLCETFIKNRDQRSTAGSEVLCSLHSEKPKLFCLEDEEPICVVCRTSRKHRSHTCVPVDEAAHDHKKDLHSDLEIMHAKLKDLHQVKDSFKQMEDHIKVQAENTEKHIKEEIMRIQLFLQNEEEERIAALRKDEKQRCEKIKRKKEEMDEKIALLLDTIQAMEKEMRADAVLFLQNVKFTKGRSLSVTDSECSSRTQVTLPKPAQASGDLIDMAKYLGNLTFKVWEKMIGIVKYTPVILDPNTAYSSLSLSKDLTKVRCMNTWQELPDNPERFMKYYNVLGSEGFSSGKHSWEVEVGDHPWWNIGVVKESVDRKGEAYLTPKDGIWAIAHESGVYFGEGGSTLILKRGPQRIRVQLDCDKGELSFHDSVNITHICTFKDKFTERMFPYFSIGPAGAAKSQDIHIC